MKPPLEALGRFSMRCLHTILLLGTCLSGCRARRGGRRVRQRRGGTLLLWS
ncbi:hypothetical protein IC582_027226 [Cucumis melo]